MKNNIVSLKRFQIEKQYKEFYGNTENYNRALGMVGSAPKSVYEIKNKLKSS
ncbi:hypothetical protein KDN24_06630 [Bacillus sp. Bva_UNVM-123]|uniref:hypothetical protein n=1 Tax=Bacillus sp. Bva_UNVM-123 TaxID=2829798 RepID=UPI00391F06EC